MKLISKISNLTSNIEHLISKILRTKRRKILATSLGILILVSSFRLFLFLNPKEAKAATLSLSTTSNTIQIDVPNRYRAIMTTDDTDDYILISDRAEDDASPDTTMKIFGSAIYDETVWYILRHDDTRITTILESTPSRVRIRVEGCYDTTAGGACLEDVAGGDDDDIKAVEEYTFTTEGISASTQIDFEGGLALASGDTPRSFSVAFNDINNNNIIPYSETILYGDGETESTQSTDGVIDGTDDVYVTLQATGNYQDVIFGSSNINGDKVLSNSTNGTDYYEVDDVDEAEAIDFYDAATQTISGKGSAQFFIQLHPQNSLNNEDEREALFNDLTNPDYLSYTTGSEWDDSVYTNKVLSYAPLAYWPLSETSGSTANDISGNNYDGSYGSVDLGQEGLGDGKTAPYFDGVNSFVNIYSSEFESAFDGDELTFVVWAKVRSITTWTDSSQLVLLKVTADSNNRIFIRKDADPALYTSSRASGTWSETSQDSTNYTNDWYSFVLTRSKSAGATGEVKGYVNGVQIGTTKENLGAFTGSLNTNETTIGSFDIYSGSRWNGWLAHVAIWDRALSPTQVADLAVPPDDYNETQGAYTSDMSASDVEVDIDAGADVSTLVNDATVSAGDAIFTVDSTTGFPSSGFAYIEGDKFSYTGTTGTTFTGIPSTGELSIIGHADNSVVSLSQRHTPMYKMRNYRKSDAPQNVTLEEDTLTLGSEYNASVKPFSTSYFAQELIWHSTFENNSAATSPDVGGSGTVNATTTFTSGRYGNGMLADANDESVTIAMANNLSAAVGTIEFWYKSTSTASGYRTFFSSSKGNDHFNLQRYPTDTDVEFCVGGGTCTTWTSILTLYNGEWHHVRLSYDTTANSTYLYIDGISEGQKTTDFPAIDTTYDLNIGSHYDGTIPVNGIVDEFRIFSSNTTPSQVSKGGDTADSDEYLADPTNNYTFDFNDDDASNRAEYIWLGTDSPYAGVNMELATDGVGSSEDFDWEYWNGTSWSALTVTEQNAGSSSFTGDGNFYFTPPSDWFPYSVNGSTDLYYIRGHLEGGSLTTDPIENRIQTDILLLHYQDKITDEDQSLIIPAISSGPNPPIAYWNFDEGYGTTVGDSSGHGNTASIYNGATWQTEDLCYTGKCLYYDGSSDHFVQNNKTRGIPTAYTLSTWLRGEKTNQIAENIYILGWDAYISLSLQDSSQNARGGILIRNEADTAYYSVWDGVDLLDNQWHHLSATVDRTSLAVNVYIDGELNYSTTISDHWTGFRNLQIGSWTTTYGNFTGFLDETKIYAYARSADEIKADATQGAGVKGAQTSYGLRDYSYLSEGLVGYWPMDEDTNNDRLDSSGNGNTLTESAGDDIDGVAGKFNQTADFEDTDTEYLTITDANQTGLEFDGDYTVNLWVNFEDKNQNSTFISKGAGVTDPFAQVGWSWIDSGPYKLYIRHWEGSSEFETSSFDRDDISDGTWYMMTATYDDDTNEVIFCLDGVCDPPDIMSNEMANNSADILFGQSQSANYLDGKMDELRVYNRTLSPSEVNALYNWGPGPVGHWTMDDNTGQYINDSSGNGLVGTLGADATVGSDDMTWSTGKHGSAVNSDGVEDYAIIPDNDLLDVQTGDMTVAAWFKTDGDHNTYVVAKDTCGNADDWLIGVEGNGQTSFRLIGDTDVSIYHGNGSAANQWHHVAAVKEGTQMKLYFEGTLRATGTAPTGLDNNAKPVYIGARGGSIGSPETCSYPIGGGIDDVRIYNYARSPNQLIEDMNAGHPAGGSPVPSQIVYYRFDEGFGDTANDVGSGGNNGDLAGSGTTCPQASSSCPTWLQSGKYDGALDYDGSDDVVLISDDNSLNTGDEMTISAWVNWDQDTGDTNYIFDASQDYLFKIEGSGKLHYDFQVSGVWQDSTPTRLSNGTVPLDTYTHIAVTYDGGLGSDNIKYYINGILDPSSYDETDTIDNPSGNLAIGNYFSSPGSTWAFDGEIDELKIYHAALTAEQIKIDMNMGGAATLGDVANQDNEGFGGNPPVGWWKMDENTGSTAYDTSSNENSGTFSAQTWGPAKYGSGIITEIDGSSEQANVSDPSSGILDFSDTDDYTVTTWIKIVNNESYVVPVWKGGSNTSNDGYDIEVSPSTGYAGCNYTDGNGSGIDSTTGTTDIRDGDWHHITCVMDRNGSEVGTAGLHFFLDGILEGSDTSLTEGSAASNSDNFIIGEYTASYEFDGVIDEVKVYDYARTRAQVAYDFNRGEPVGHWRLDECSGTTAYDSSDNGNNGTISIGVTGSNTSAGTCGGSSGEAWYEGVTGKRNASLDLDGTNDYVFVTDPGTDSELDMSSSFSLSLWAKWDSVSGEQFLFTKGDATDNNYWIAKGGDQYPSGVECGFYDGTDYGTGLNITFSTGVWYHLACSFDDANDVMKFYIDGVERSSTTVSVSPTGALNNGELRIGRERDTYGYYMKGKLDEVKIYNYPLSADQIKRDFNEGPVRFGPLEGNP